MAASAASAASPASLFSVDESHVLADKPGASVLGKAAKAVRSLWKEDVRCGRASWVFEQLAAVDSEALLRVLAAAGFDADANRAFVQSRLRGMRALVEAELA